jgi:MinD superfamily P-loop ATPase
MKIAIASGKGGTGKTTLSVNLSSLLAAENDENFQQNQMKIFRWCNIQPD